jgi:hypothetical protein
VVRKEEGERFDGGRTRAPAPLQQDASARFLLPFLPHPSAPSHSPLPGPACGPAGRRPARRRRRRGAGRRRCCCFCRFGRMRERIVVQGKKQRARRVGQTAPATANWDRPSAEARRATIRPGWRGASAVAPRFAARFLLALFSLRRSRSICCGRRLDTRQKKKAHARPLTPIHNPQPTHLIAVECFSRPAMAAGPAAGGDGRRGAGDGVGVGSRRGADAAGAGGPRTRRPREAAGNAVGVDEVVAGVALLAPSGRGGRMFCGAAGRVSCFSRERSSQCGAAQRARSPARPRPPARGLSALTLQFTPFLPSARPRRTPPSTHSHHVPGLQVPGPHARRRGPPGPPLRGRPVSFLLVVFFCRKAAGRKKNHWSARWQARLVACARRAEGLAGPRPRPGGCASAPPTRPTWRADLQTARTRPARASFCFSHPRRRTRASPSSPLLPQNHPLTPTTTAPAPSPSRPSTAMSPASSTWTCVFGRGTFGRGRRA